MSDRRFRDSDRRDRRKVRRAGQKRMLELLEGRPLLNASLAQLPAVQVLQYEGYQVPLDGSGSGAANQTFSVTSSNPDIGATVEQGQLSQFLTLNVSHQAAPGQSDVSFGISSPATITIQLFGDLTPTSASEIEQFVTSGYYNGKNFPRVASGFPNATSFVEQAGSKNADGSGSSGFQNFSNEIVQQVAFTNPGQMALANGGPGTDNTQFFITTGAPTVLNYGYTVMGQVVSGMNVVNEISQVATQNSSVFVFSGVPEKSSPINPITINSATLSTTNPNGVLHIDATQARAGETSTIMVTATDPATSSSVTQSFQVTVAANPGAASLPLNLQPIAYPVTQSYPSTPQTITLTGDPANSQTSPNQTLNFKITAQPAHGTLSTITQPTASSPATATVVYTPDPNNPGSDSFQYTVTNSGANLTSKAATVTLAPVQPPVAQPVKQFSFGDPTTVVLTGSSPVTGQAVTYSIVTQPTKGTLSQLNAAAGTVVYTPNSGATGDDTFEYEVTTVGPPSPGVPSQPATVTMQLSQKATSPTPTPTSTPSPTPSPTPTPTPTTTPTSTPTPTPTPTLVTVKSVQVQPVKLSKKKATKALVVSYSGPLQPGPAQNLADYQVAVLSKTKKAGLHAAKAVSIASAQYSSTANTVTLIPRGTLPTQLLQVTVVGAGILDTDGRSIDAAGTGQSGGKYQTTLKG
jgi:cyclophilin family peptidyl-prolyl cis-trans isomerase